MYFDTTHPSPNSSSVSETPSQIRVLLLISLLLFLYNLLSTVGLTCLHTSVVLTLGARTTCIRLSARENITLPPSATVTT